MRIRKKDNVIFILLLLVIFLGIGYAYLTTSLSINGTSDISSASWNIRFQNIQVKDGSVTPTSAATINSDANVVTYSITLSKPGDYYQFTVDAKNYGTIDGMISSVSSKLGGVEITTLPDYLDYYVTYDNGVAIATNQLLPANATVTYKVHVGYKSNISPNQLPSTNQALNLSFEVTYVQATDDAVEVPDVKYVANLVDYNVEDNNNVRLGEAIPAGITQYNTAAEALAAIRAATNDNTVHFYFKHMLRNNIVVESYVEFEVTDQMAVANPGMTSGTYALRGGTDDVSVYDDNREKLLRAFGSSNCTQYSNYLRCSVPGLGSSATITGGIVVANDTIWHCNIYLPGNSVCSYG